MPHYKDQNNKLYFLDNPEDAVKFIPTGCVEITDAEAGVIRDSLFNIINYRFDLDTQIDAKAEEVRKRYLTSCPLQGATYISKEADARAYKAAGYPTPFNEFTYQYVWAEMIANGDATAQIAADRIIYEADLYNNGTALVKGKGPLIEKERRAAKIAIAAAADKTALDAALAAGISALDAL